MSNNSTKGANVVRLSGCEFRRVKNGLDEVEVTSFINELVTQRDTFMQRVEHQHLSSLTKLAQKTVTEADKLAEKIRTEAVDKGEAEAAAIVAKAEEQAQQMIKEKRSEIITIASEEAVAIKAEAEQKAELLLENQKKSIQLKLRDFVHRLCDQLLSELESLKQQAAKLDVEFEDKLSQPSEETSTVTVEQGERHDEFLELIREDADQTNTDRPDWEVEILPPIDLVKIMEVLAYLDNLAEVEKTEIIPTDRPSIMVFLREQIHLIDTLKALPEVVQVKGDATDAPAANGKPRKVQIVLSETTKTKE